MLAFLKLSRSSHALHPVILCFRMGRARQTKTNRGSTQDWSHEKEVVMAEEEKMRAVAIERSIQSFNEHYASNAPSPQTPKQSMTPISSCEVSPVSEHGDSSSLSDASNVELVSVRLLTDILGREGKLQVPMEMDGNCLFKAAVHQLKNNASLLRTPEAKMLASLLADRAQAELRRLCCRSLKRHRKELQNYWTPTLQERNFRQYLKSMVEDKTWGDDLVLRVMCRRLQVNAEVHQLPPHPVIHHAYHNCTPCLQLAYYEHPGHYNSIIAA